MRYLSKSKLIANRQCPKRLWLELHRPERRDDSGSETAFRIGNEVGDAARKVYDPEGSGTLIDIEELGYNGAFRTSAALFQKGEGPIFEAGFHADGALAFADVMLPSQSYGALGWRMLEVKSNTAVADYHRDDLAIQAHLASRMGVPLVSAGIAHIDNTFVYGGDGDYRGLFCEVDLTVETEHRSHEVEEWIREAQEVATLADEPEIPMGPQCSDPFHCPFTAYCSRDQPSPDYPLSSLPHLRSGRREAIELLGFIDLREVPELLLTDTQAWVRAVTISGETWFDAAGAEAALAPHGFPAWFLDFETVAMPVPIWKGTRPYQQIPFQFSLHRIYEDGTLSHDAFLKLDRNDPSEQLARELVGKSGTLGPVYAYHASFERRVIHELAARFPVMSDSLLALADRLIDLKPVAKEHFYHPSQHGSWSLKAVLPAACPDLSYDTLNGVADGIMAGDAYREAIALETTAERKTAIEQELLAYCHLDTFAMVRLWKLFRGDN